jgi:hypothetical protein
MYPFIRSDDQVFAKVEHAVARREAPVASVQFSREQQPFLQQFESNMHRSFAGQQLQMASAFPASTGNHPMENTHTHTGYLIRPCIYCKRTN